MMHRKILASLFLLVLTAAFRLEVNTHPSFDEFLAEYEKKYQAEGEYFYRRAVYKTNLELIDRLNAEEMGTAVYAVNHLADLTDREVKQLMGVRIPADYRPSYVKNFTDAEVYEPLKDTPEIWNWEQQGAVTSVRNQGSCGSCWAFSTAQNIEGQWWMKTKDLVDFSEQQLVDCDKSNFGCGGGWPYMAIDWLHNNSGIMTMNDYPTRANYSGPCQFDSSRAKTQIKGYMNITKNETVIKDALYKLGPLSILLDFTGMTYYKSGIANPRWCGTWPDHALLLVGYGTKDGDYWLIKNTWGSKWGINGYLMLERGKDKCGISDWATTAVLPQ